MKLILPLISLCCTQHYSLVTPLHLELVNLLCDVAMYFHLLSRYIGIAENLKYDTASVDMTYGGGGGGGYIKVILS